jgi:ADP-ribosylglycohydrolase
LDSNNAQGAVFKGWVESRFGLFPTYHKQHIASFISKDWIMSIEEKMNSRYHNNCIDMQLDLLLISQYGEFAYSPYSGKASAYIVDTVQTVLHYFFSMDSFESCLIATVNQGGDADTTGALVGMLAGAKYGVQQIPKRWLKQLDQQIVAQIRQQTMELIRLAESL